MKTVLMCIRHHLPILPCNLRKGAKRQGCSKCQHKWNLARYSLARLRNSAIPPISRRPLCKQHGLPLLPNYLRRGYKTVGCSKCNREQNRATQLRNSKKPLPPPEQRLCRLHGKPIGEARWRGGSRTSGCSKCSSVPRRSQESRKRREERWKKTNIFCVRHPDRICNRCLYVHGGKRRCASCNSRRADGQRRPGQIRHYRKHSRKQSYAKSMRKRANGTIDWSRAHNALKVFERSIGMTADFPRSGSREGRTAKS